MFDLPDNSTKASLNRMLNVHKCTLGREINISMLIYVFFPVTQKRTKRLPAGWDDKLFIDTMPKLRKFSIKNYLFLNFPFCPNKESFAKLPLRHMKHKDLEFMP